MSQQLPFIPWHKGDPVGPFAPWMYEHLDKNQLLSMARVELEYDQAVLEAKMKFNTQALKIMGGPAQAK